MEAEGGPFRSPPMSADLARMRHVAASNLPSASYGRADSIHVDRFADVSPRSSSSTVEINGRMWQGFVVDPLAISASECLWDFLSGTLDEFRCSFLSLTPSQALLWPKNNSKSDKCDIGVDGQR